MSVCSLSAHDLVDEGGQVGPLEGLLEAGHLVDDAAQRPDVRLLVVHLALAHLGAERERKNAASAREVCDFHGPESQQF